MAAATVAETKRIDLGLAQALLWQAVATQGKDFVYNPGGLGSEGCYNVPRTEDARGKPLPADSPKRLTGCLVGTAMQCSGLIDNMEPYAMGSVLRFEDYLEDEALHYFSVAQRAQDCGSTWGEALERADTWREGFDQGYLHRAKGKARS